MTTTTTRRAILAGTAALPALAIIPARAVAAAGGVDPIFAAIEKHRQIEAAFVAACNEHVEKAREPAREDRVVKLGHRSSNALGELVAMTPTTVAGCAAVLRYLETHEKSYDEAVLLDNHSDNVRVPARDLLSRIAATLEAAVQS